VINNALALGYAAASVHGSEGFRALAYLDKLAVPWRWTIGFGTTRIGGEPVQLGDICTEAQALAWAAKDMQSALNYVTSHVKVPLNDWQAAACTALTFNIGMGNFCNSTVLAALNAGDYRRAADCFLEYDHAGGVQVPGLTARRERERAMFLVAMPESDSQAQLDRA
jgi:lysozyme